jgi:hypothetical protein
MATATITPGDDHAAPPELNPMGVEIDPLAPERFKNLISWEEGTD